MKRERQGFHITYVHSLFQDLSRYSIIFDLLTLTELSYFMCVFLGSSLSLHTIIFDLVNLDLEV